VAAFERHPSVTSRKINRCSVNERDGEHDEDRWREFRVMDVLSHEHDAGFRSNVTRVKSARA
jgi:hypothetical protein